MAPRLVRRFRYFLGGRNAFQLRRTRSLEIGEPYDFRHVLHIGVNDQHGMSSFNQSEFYSRAQDLKYLFTFVRIEYTSDYLNYFQLKNK